MSPTALSPLAAAARAQVGHPYYGLVYLALASLAYADEAQACQSHVVADLAAAIPALPPLPAPAGSSSATVPGHWELVWGPAFTAKYANLMYAATYNDAVSGVPIFATVAIRGTDTSSGVDALLKQLLEDTADLVEVNWDKAVAGACGTPDVVLLNKKIAKGTCGGLQTFTTLTPAAGAAAAGTTIGAYLAQTLLSIDADIPIVVTGHSLGGCQATVVAMLLAQTLPSGTIIAPNPFAPPTAGNGPFAKGFDQRFATTANVWWNTLDLVPMAYADTAGMANLWGAYQWPAGTSSPTTGQNGPGLPAQTQQDIAALDAVLTLYNYQQVTAGTHRLNGALPSQATMTAFLNAMTMANPPAWDSWEAQLMWQHFPPCYHALISTQCAADIVAPYPMPPIPDCART